MTSIIPARSAHRIASWALLTSNLRNIFLRCVMIVCTLEKRSEAISFVVFPRDIAFSISRSVAVNERRSLVSF